MVGGGAVVLVVVDELDVDGSSERPGAVVLVVEGVRAAVVLVEEGGGAVVVEVPTGRT